MSPLPKPKCNQNGKYSLQDGSLIQHYRCKACTKRFSEKTGTPMFRLRTPTSIVSIALKMRGEGMGVRASSRVLDKSHSTILRWEARMAAQVATWSPDFSRYLFFRGAITPDPAVPKPDSLIAWSLMATN
jgi:transposase-like protein